MLLLGLLLAMLGAGATYLMREMAAEATIEASTRLRRAVYLHTFRLGTLAFRALGPTEAVTVFTRHVEAVHDALFTHLTVYFREAIKFGLLLTFALVVHPLLALAFLIVAGLVWMLGGQVIEHFNRQSRTATNQASESLTIMRESLMMMRLVKCYMMEPFNRSRVERQLAHYSNVQMIRYRGEAISQPLLVLLGILCAVLLLFVCGVIILTGHLGVPGVIALATALVSLYQPLERWLESRRLLKRGRDCAEQLFKFLERRGDVGQVIGAEFLEPLQRGIEFDNVSLREPGSNRMLLEEVTLTIPAGKRIGVIGADDLEKHALVYLIPRLLDPTAGEIRIDQHNLRWVTLDSLRNQISHGAAAQPGLPRHGGQQHRLRRPGLHPAADHRGGQDGSRPPLHPEAAGGLRDAHRRDGPLAERQPAVSHRPGTGHPARPGPVDHRGTGNASGRRHQEPAGRHHGPDLARPDHHLHSRTASRPFAPAIGSSCCTAAGSPPRESTRTCWPRTRCTATCITWSSTRSPTRFELIPVPPAITSVVRHRASSRSRTGRGVFQVIQVDPHDLPADVRREQAEAIEARTLGLDALLQGERHGFLVQGYGNGAVAALRGRVVDQRPVVDLPWREDRPGSGLGLGSLGGRQRGVEVVADPRRPADVDAEEMPGLDRRLAPCWRC